MMTGHELARVRRQTQRRIRLLLAQRRITARHYPARRLVPPPTPPEHRSAEPPSEN